MNEEQNIIVHAEWAFPETSGAARDKRWYLIAGAFAVFCLIYAIFSGNFLFAAIVVMISFIYVFSSMQESPMVPCAISEEGLHIGRHYYPYKELLAFWVLYEPSEQVKHVYFDFRNSLRPTLAIPLQNQNPLAIRDILLQYLPEDLEKEEESFFDVLGRHFRL